MRKVYVLLVFALLCFQQLGAQVLLQQSFDNAALPEGWRQDLDDGNTKGWIPLQSSSHSISNPFSGSHFVEFESYLTKSMLGARLISPEVNIPTKEFFLEFYSVVTSGSKGLHVDISRDFGATWVEDVLFIDKAEAETDWVKHTVDISSYLPCEHFRVRFRAVSSYGSGKCCIAVDDVKIYKPENMAFDMATTLQSNTSIVSVGQTAAEVIAVKVNCTGALNPLLVNSINFNTAATTSCADITKASVYYTGSSSSFSTENLVGHIDNPNADFVINANQQLIEGDNYFWLAYDISSTAVEGNGIDAICNSIIVDNILKTPDVTNPDGSRVIKNILSMLSGTKTVKVINNLMFYDDGGASANYSNNFEGSVTFQPKDELHKIQLSFTAFETYYSHKLLIYNGSNDTAPLIGEYSNSTLPNDIKSTSADGCLTIKFSSGSYSSKAGWEAEVSNYQPQPMSFVSADGFQNNISALAPGDIEQEIVGFTVKTKGLLTPLSAQSVTFDISATTNNADITKAYLYFSNTNTFNTSSCEKVAEISSITGNQITFNLSKPLTEGDSYFWLAVDVDQNAAQNNIIDASISKVVISGSDYSVATNNPEGSRVVKRIYTMEEYKEITTSGGMFYDDGGAESDYSDSFEGVVIFKPTNANNKMRISFNYFDTESNSGCTYDYMIIYDGADPSTPELGRFCGTDTPPEFTSTSADGNLCIYFHSDSGTGKAGWEATIEEYTPAPMTFASSNTIEYSNADVCKGMVAEPIIGLKVVTNGSLNPLLATNISVDLLGTQDVSKINVYYTGKSAVFSRDNLVGEQLVSTTNNSVAINKELGSGDNYFWVTYDISPNATVGAFAKAEVSNITIGGLVYQNSKANLSGRLIQSYVNMPSTKDNTIVVGDDISFYDDGGKDGLHAKDIIGSITFVPADATKKIKVEFTDFELQNYGVDFDVFNGLTNNGLNKITELKGDQVPAPVKSTSDEGALHFYFKSSPMFTQKAGWISRVYCYDPKPLELERSQATQRERSFLQRNTQDQLILGVELTTSGEKEVVDFTKMTFSTQGCTKASDISSAKLYYTNQLNKFQTGELLAEVKNPSGEFSFEFNKQVKYEDTYYYWLCFDIANDAVPNDIIDAVLVSVTANGNVVNATEGNPLGKRVIRKALSGTYTIDANPNVDADFASITEATQALNILGVSDAVSFNIASGEYQGALLLNEISGASNDNTIVFTSATNNSNDVTIKWNGTEEANTVLTMNGADFVTFQHLSFINKGSRYSRLLDLYGEANNNKFINNVFEGVELNVSDNEDDKILVYYGGSDHKSLDNNNHFIGNTFKYGKMAMSYQGINAISDFEEGTVIKDNTFFNQYFKSVYLNYQDNIIIEGNTFIQNDCKREYQAIDFFQNHKNATIVKNTFNLDCGSKGGSAIFLRNFKSVDQSHSLIANNFVYMTSTSRQVVGIELQDVDYLDIYHNTIKIDGSSTSSKAMFFDKRGSSVFDNLKIKNNIFSVYSGGFVIWSKAQATNSVFTNNNYFVNSDATNFAKYGDLVAANITDWQAAIDDENSINIDPEFVSATDLHISGTDLKFGVQLPEVSDDIDGDIRNAATPYIGADEIPDATFEGGYPKFTNVSAVSANMVLKIAEAGTVYFVVMPKGSNLPSVQQIKEGQNVDGQNALFSGNIALAVSDEKSTLIDGLTEKTSYDVVLVVEKQNGEYSSVIKLLLSTLDVTAPEFVENTPLLKEVTDNAFMVEAKINESGFVYYALYAGNINYVSVDDVKNGNSAILAGKINADKESFIRCNDLSAGTKYNLFVIAEDNQENANIQNMPIMVSVKTLFGISVSNFTANSVEGSKVVLNWLQPENPANVIIVSSEDNNFGSPQSGTEYNVGDVFNNGGKVLYKGKASNFEHTTVEVGKTYYYRIYSYNSEKEYSQYLQNFAVVKNDKWTILVYLDGDNNLEGNAISDINEMESVNLPDDVNVIVQIDRTPGEDFSNGNWADTRRYKITHDNDLSIINSQRLDTENPLGELNMGDQKTLSDFVEWGIKSYPAEKVMLIMWDHGGGWRSETNFNVTKGVCWDDTNGNDYLEMREVTDALASAESKTNKKLNILGFDVCLAGMMEVAYQTKDVVADYSVFSQALVPGSGWNYDGWLTTLANNVDASSLELAQSAVNSYKDEYSGKLNVTMSAFDMSKVDELKESVDNFTTAYLSTTLEASVINGAFNNSDLFTARKNYIDLGLFMNYCANNLSDNNSKAKATDVINKLSQAVVLTGNTGNFINATGLNIYFHKFNDYEWNEYCAPYCNFADKSNWKWFVKNYDKDGLAPMFIDGYPKTVNISNTSLDIVVKTNKTGNAYYVILDADADAPSVSQVKEGKNSTGEAVADNYCGSVATVKYLVSKKSITNLASNSNYDIYFVLDDEAGVTCNDVIKYKTATLNRKVATFENLLLANNSFNNGSDNSGGFNDGGFFFQNYYSSMSWSGFAYSNKTDNTVESLPGQYTAYAGSGAENSSNYGVCYVMGTFSRVDITDAGDGVPVSGFYVTNNNYAYYSMKNGDVVAKKFGGESGNDPDWFKLTVKGVDKQGHYTGDVEFYLADFRSDNNSDDYIVDSWKWVDLTSLGNVDKLEFRLSSSDNGSWGMNTPAYFCLDNLNGNAPVDHAPVVKAAIDNIVVNQNSADKVINLNTVFEDPDGDELTFEVVSNSNQSLIQTAINSGNLTISFVNGEAGDGQITLKATANGKSVSTTFGVTVNAVEDHAPVVIKAIDNIVVNQNSADRVINLNTVFEDPDGDELTFEVVSNSNQSLIQTAINSGNLTISFVNGEAGDGQITLKATANGKSVSTTFGVTVNAVEDHAPVVIKAIDNIIVDMNADAVTFDLTKVFADADGDLLTFEVESNNNSEVVNATITGSNLTVLFVTDKTGEALISVKATANGKSVSTQFNVTVNAVEDHAPVVIKAIDNIIVDMNADAVTFDLTKVFADADGDELTFEVESNNNTEVVNATITGSNLTVSFVTDKTGEALISVKATANGKSVSTQFNVTVKAVATAINSVNNYNITLYPNPCSGNFIIDGGSDIIESVRVVSIAGQTVMYELINSSKANVNISNCNQGVYIVYATINGKTICKRIVKQ